MDNNTNPYPVLHGVLLDVFMSHERFSPFFIISLPHVFRGRWSCKLIGVIMFEIGLYAMRSGIKSGG